MNRHILFQNFCSEKLKSMPLVHDEKGQICQKQKKFYSFRLPVTVHKWIDILFIYIHFLRYFS
jgi:hypothetical protein